MMSSSAARVSVSAALLLAVSACGGAASDALTSGPATAPPGTVEAERPAGNPAAPAWGTVTQNEANRSGLDASEACAAPESLALLQELQREGSPVKSHGGYTTDYGGFIDWNLRMAGAASFPDADDKAVPIPPEILTICWYSGAFGFAEDTDSGTASGSNIVVVFDEKGGRRVPVLSDDPIGIIAPSPPQQKVPGQARPAREVSHRQMPGTRVVPGLSESERQAAKGRPSPPPGAIPRG